MKTEDDFRRVAGQMIRIRKTAEKKDIVLKLEKTGSGLLYFSDPDGNQQVINISDIKKARIEVQFK